MLSKCYWTHYWGISSPPLPCFSCDTPRQILQGFYWGECPWIRVRPHWNCLDYVWEWVPVFARYILPAEPILGVGSRICLVYSACWAYYGSGFPYLPGIFCLLSLFWEWVPVFARYILPAEPILGVGSRICLVYSACWAYFGSGFPYLPGIFCLLSLFWEWVPVFAWYILPAEPILGVGSRICLVYSACWAYFGSGFPYLPGIFCLLSLFWEWVPVFAWYILPAEPILGVGSRICLVYSACWAYFGSGFPYLPGIFCLLSLFWEWVPVFAWYILPAEPILGVGSHICPVYSACWAYFGSGFPYLPGIFCLLSLFWEWVPVFAWYILPAEPILGVGSRICLVYSACWAYFGSGFPYLPGIFCLLSLFWEWVPIFARYILPAEPILGVGSRICLVYSACWAYFGSGFPYLPGIFCLLSLFWEWVPVFARYILPAEPILGVGSRICLVYSACWAYFGSGFPYLPGIFCLLSLFWEWVPVFAWFCLLSLFWEWVPVFAWYILPAEPILGVGSRICLVYSACWAYFGSGFPYLPGIFCLLSLFWEWVPVFAWYILPAEPILGVGSRICLVYSACWAYFGSGFPYLPGIFCLLSLFWEWVPVFARYILPAEPIMGVGSRICLVYSACWAYFGSGFPYLPGIFCLLSLFWEWVPVFARYILPAEPILGVGSRICLVYSACWAYFGSGFPYLPGIFCLLSLFWEWVPVFAWYILPAEPILGVGSRICLVYSACWAYFGSGFPYLPGIFCLLSLFWEWVPVFAWYILPAEPILGVGSRICPVYSACWAYFGSGFPYLPGIFCLLSLFWEWVPVFAWYILPAEPILGVGSRICLVYSACWAYFGSGFPYLPGIFCLLSLFWEWVPVFAWYILPAEPILGVGSRICPVYSACWAYFGSGFPYLPGIFCLLSLFWEWVPVFARYILPAEPILGVGSRICPVYSACWAYFGSGFPYLPGIFCLLSLFWEWVPVFAWYILPAEPILGVGSRICPVYSACWAYFGSGFPYLPGIFCLLSLFWEWVPVFAWYILPAEPILGVGFRICLVYSACWAYFGSGFPYLPGIFCLLSLFWEWVPVFAWYILPAEPILGVGSRICLVYSACWAYFGSGFPYLPGIFCLLSLFWEWVPVFAWYILPAEPILGVGSRICPVYSACWAYFGSGFPYLPGIFCLLSLFWKWVPVFARYILPAEPILGVGSRICPVYSACWAYFGSGFPYLPGIFCLLSLFWEWVPVFARYILPAEPILGVGSRICPVYSACWAYFGSGFPYLPGIFCLLSLLWEWVPVFAWYILPAEPILGVGSRICLVYSACWAYFGSGFPYLPGIFCLLSLFWEWVPVFAWYILPAEPIMGVGSRICLVYSACWAYFGSGFPYLPGSACWAYFGSGFPYLPGIFCLLSLFWEWVPVFAWYILPAEPILGVGSRICLVYSACWAYFGSGFPYLPGIFCLLSLFWEWVPVFAWYILPAEPILGVGSRICPVYSACWAYFGSGFPYLPGIFCLLSLFWEWVPVFAWFCLLSLFSIVYPLSHCYVFLLGILVK